MEIEGDGSLKRTSLPGSAFGKTGGVSENPGVFVHDDEGVAKQVIIEDPVAGANGCFAVSPWIPDQTEARGEVAPIILIPAGRAHHSQVRYLTGPANLRRLVNGSFQSVSFEWNAVEFI